MKEINNVEQVVLINEEQFNMYSPVVTTMDYEYLEPYIAIAQELHISPIIGDGKLREIQGELVCNRLSVDNRRLVDAIAPCLACYAIYQALPFNWLQVSRAGVEM